MAGVFRAGTTVALLVLGALGLSWSVASAIQVPIDQVNPVEGSTVSLNAPLQKVGYSHSRHRRYHFPRVTLGIDPSECFSKEKRRTYRHNGLAHRPRHHHTPEGRHYYYDPYWDFEPWWCNDPQIIPRHRAHHHHSSRYSAHVRWCLDHYRSYNPHTNSWVGYSGKVYQCDSPYDSR